MGERGGLNLYAFAANNSINFYDELGLSLLSIPAEELGEIEAEIEGGGISWGEIAKEWGLTVDQVAQIAAQLATAKAVQEIIDNARRNAKGKDPFEKAKNALRQVQRGIQNTLNTIKEHEGWISNPSSYPGGLQPPFDQHPEWAVDKWMKQVANMKLNLDRMNQAVKALQKAVDAVCKCWYKPWTWF